MNEDQKNLLQQIFDNVNSWLHFAEAKNAALIAFNVALMSALFSFEPLKSCALVFSIIIVSLLISTIFSLWSFKPINNKLEKTDGAKLEENLLHFAYIASLEVEEYIKKIYESYWEKSDINISTISRLEIDYCKEIIENARITMRKQHYFKIGFYIVMFAIMVIGVLIICA